MQKLNVPCIKTGEFARLCGTNKRTLIHYDEIGLFSPALTDEKGYRFYSENQCDVFFTITWLKELGMPLKEIKEYISNRSPEVIEQLLLTQQEKVTAELYQLSRMKTVIDNKLSLLRRAGFFPDIKNTSGVFREIQEEDELLVLSDPIYSGDHDVIFSRLCAHITQCSTHHLNCGYPYGAMLPSSSLTSGDDTFYAYFFTKVSPPVCTVPQHLQTHFKKRGEYAAVYLRGNYYESGAAMNLLFSYLREKDLTAGEFVYKEALLDELSAKEEDYLTRISVRIREPGAKTPGL